MRHYRAVLVLAMLLAGSTESAQASGLLIQPYPVAQDSEKAPVSLAPPEKQFQDSLGAAPQKSRPPVRPPVPDAAMPRWGAQTGQDMRDVLQNWSNLAQVDMVWANENNFPVLRPLDMSGTYEAAVQGLLDQYRAEGFRPVAKLYHNTPQKKRVLVIETARGL